LINTRDDFFVRLQKGHSQFKPYNYAIMRHDLY